MITFSGEIMWFSNKKTLVEQDIFRGFVDHHSHILPGVDDGVKTVEESMAILAEYEQMGVKEVWLTPHIQEYMPNTTEELKERYELLKDTYKGHIILRLAAEYMLDPLFTERMAADDLLYHSLSGEEPQLLVETSYFNPPMDLWGVLRDIMGRGIRPILAHPERYMYMRDEDYERLHDMGVILQMNLPSVLGAYGKHVEKRARKLLDRGYISLYGTDIHSQELLEMMKRKRTLIVKH